MDAILSKQHARRTFYVIVSLILAVALLVRFFLIPYFDPCQAVSVSKLASSLVDSFIISLSITVFLGTFIFWITPDVVKRAKLEVVEPKEINPLLKTAVTTTKSWIYKGGCGRYTRATTLPRLAESARKESLGRDITICVLNPNNDDLCAAYATYRRSLRSGTSGAAWTREMVQEEVLATAVFALRYQFSEPLLRIRVFFLNNFSAFRLDVADQFVVVTKEDKDAAAFRADAGTYFYNSYKDDVRLAERQSVEMKCCGELKFNGEMDEEKLTEAIQCASLFDVDRLNELNLKNILKHINKPEDPY